MTTRAIRYPAQAMWTGTVWTMFWWGRTEMTTGEVQARPIILGSSLSNSTIDLSNADYKLVGEAR